MWRVPGERIKLDLDGPTVEVEPIRSWAVQYQMLRLAAVFRAAPNPEAEYAALVPLFERFIYEAQPTWEIVDHRGTIPATAGGMVRLPLELSVQIINQWLDSLIVPQSSVVDEVIPPGPLNIEIKRRLKKKAA